ncbi:hypothetical protein H2200_008225 [Cladophialophora chaetospira]|uniref:Uncharacterized protein n=1 Tax=Cladophialophora chaetospira TaxID=386627 RepID=A0AA38X5D9_9EURO|nr:hypothetical protein H2200_008225 [Cladophialophora chaetospira]
MNAVASLFAANKAARMRDRARRQKPRFSQTVSPVVGALYISWFLIVSCFIPIPIAYYRIYTIEKKVHDNSSLRERLVDALKDPVKFQFTVIMATFTGLLFGAVVINLWLTHTILREKGWGLYRNHAGPNEWSMETIEKLDAAPKPKMQDPPPSYYDEKQTQGVIDTRRPSKQENMQMRELREKQELDRLAPVTARSPASPGPQTVQKQATSIPPTVQNQATSGPSTAHNSATSAQQGAQAPAQATQAGAHSLQGDIPGYSFHLNVVPTSNSGTGLATTTSTLPPNQSSRPPRQRKSSKSSGLPKSPGPSSSMSEHAIPRPPSPPRPQAPSHPMPEPALNMQPLPSRSQAPSHRKPVPASNMPPLPSGCQAPSHPTPEPATKKSKSSPCIDIIMNEDAHDLMSAFSREIEEFGRPSGGGHIVGEVDTADESTLPSKPYSAPYVEEEQ